MIKFTYKCVDCGVEFIIEHLISDAEVVTKCGDCGGQLYKTVGIAGMITPRVH